MTAPLTIILAKPRGFCAGVERAIEIVEKALDLYGPPIYVRHEIVHNKWVVEDLRSKGVIFVDEVSDVPDGAITIFSAHGISEKVENSAKLRDLPVIDATCPLVTKVHREAQRYEAEGREVILIGHAGHPEVEGTMGRVKAKVHLVASEQDVGKINVGDAQNLAYVTQTTLSVDDTKSIISALKRRFPSIAGPDLRDICYATQNRQNAVRDLARQVDCVLVIGSANSSNSNRLRDLAAEMGVKAYLIDGQKDINPAWLDGITSIGVTAGASAPELLVDKIIEGLQVLRPDAVVTTLAGIHENTRFKLPPEVTTRPFALRNVLEIMNEDGVVILHGIFRTHRSMSGLARYLKKQGFATLNVGYPSTRMTLEEISEHIQPRVEAFINGLSGKVHFVGYSMGGLVIRAYLHRYRPAKLGRVVMIGTPNKGSEVADVVKHWRLYKRLYGPAGQQLVTTESVLEDTVYYELGIIAGSLSALTPIGHYVIGKQSDGTVSVDSTKLEGMKEHIVVPVPHTLFPHSRRIWRLTGQFITVGHFGNS